MTVQSMYIGEISSDQLRGALGSFMNLSMAVGFLIMNSLGPFLDYNLVQWILLAFPCIFFCLFTLMPESPFFYLAKDRREEAFKSLSFLRDHPEKSQVINELEQIEINLQASQDGDWKTTAKSLLSPGNVKALTIGGVLIASQQLSGINGIFFYAGDIFTRSGLSIDTDVAVIILSAVQLTASTITPFLADRCGRRPLLLFSTSFSSFFLFAFAGYKYADANGYDVRSSLNWLPIVSLVGYLIAFSCGLASITWAIISEIFPPNIKSIATALMTCIVWICTFMITKCLPILADTIGEYFVFGSFGVFAALGFIFTWFVVFETKGLSLMEVQERLHSSR